MSIKPSVAWVLGCMVLLCTVACEERQPSGHAGKATVGEQPVLQGKVVLHLYFVDPESSYLTAEDVLVVQPDNATALGTIIVEALLEGPRKAFTRAIPPGTSLKAFHLLENGTAYVDLSKEVKENHPGGARSELMTIYSLVNSIVLNLPEVDAVKILVDGQEQTTLAGHMDLRYPFTANMLLIR